jgi:hypothetical protein
MQNLKEISHFHKGQLISRHNHFCMHATTGFRLKPEIILARQVQQPLRLH